ncbi:symplekin-like [Protopterus annectens]|uniref:symplekin-like n=1 Tax=Protopterus annectens TaxID=7888 RepID=UPI001CFA6E68|nr:symplekin-like [Protopterus annectens]
MMAKQMVSADAARGVEQIKFPKRKQKGMKRVKQENELIKNHLSPLPQQGQTSSVVTCIESSQPQEALHAKQCTEPINLSTKKRSHKRNGQEKIFHWSGTNQKMSDSHMENLMFAAVDRIIHSLEDIAHNRASQIPVKILSRLITQLDRRMKAAVMDFILEDIKKRHHLAFAWIFQEYSVYLNQYPLGSLQDYEECLISLLLGLQAKPDHKDKFFSRLVLEAPVVTDGVLEVIKRCCEDETTAYLGMSTFRDLIFSRPARRFQYLHVLLDLCCGEKVMVRRQAVMFVKMMHEKDHLQEYIEKFALNYLQLLVLPVAPSVLFVADEDIEVAAPWTEETVKQCLSLYLALLPQNHKLIHELACVYASAVSDVQYIVLHILQQPIREMGLNSPEISLLMENCPKGAETLVKHCLYILSNKGFYSSRRSKRMCSNRHQGRDKVKLPIHEDQTKLISYQPAYTTKQ